MRLALIFFVTGLFTCSAFAADYPPDQRHYWRVIQPIFRKHCNDDCHNADDNKGGLNLNRYDFIIKIQQDGELFSRLVGMIEDGSMPPENRPPMPQADQDTVITYIKKYLMDALAEPDPGLVAPRRLSRREYGYAIEDLTGLAFDAETFLPKDASGGEGFDNYANTLYFTPLLMERYLEAAEWIVEETACNLVLWREIVPAYRPSWSTTVRVWWQRMLYDRDISLDAPLEQAGKTIQEFATRAYRRFLSPEEKQQLLDFFAQVYTNLPRSPHRYDLSVQEVLKAILVSPNFLIRQEADPPREGPYPVSDFELASRLSFFLWSSIPDDTLLQAAYRQELQDTLHLKEQVDRMLQNPKVKRMAESFAAQWLEIDKLKDPAHEVDAEKYPEYNAELEQYMHQEVVEYFYHTLSDSRDLLELIDGKYTFLNEPLARHYGIEGVDGLAMRKVELADPIRGGILGMGGVLTATSLPTRTSPVLRGKWVLEKILGTPAKAPPPDVPELEAAKATHEEMTLRELLVIHRSDPACMGCHQEMDDMGFALENFDAIGRWRNGYGVQQAEIDASGYLKSGEYFVGPEELKKVLAGKQELFAKSLSKKMLGFALGRSIDFIDTQTVHHLTETLMNNDFDPIPFLQEIAMSFPFRYKISDPVVVDRDL
jgi:hypothetical protein